MTAIKEIIAQLEATEKDPCQGLSQELFQMVSRLTPMVNVDLLLRDSSDRILMTWRPDAYYGDGWHIPGGIVRFKESFAARITKVAAAELGTTVRFDPTPERVQQIIAKRATRGHFISMLYNCKLTASLPKNMQFRAGSPKPGEWCWFKERPDNLTTSHIVLYSELFPPYTAVNPAFAATTPFTRI